ncbi:type II secretion system GspH family protein [Deltaproteobacteria bacterium]|nr:type II secretion system GspH family protein [Deltaproteobacteria bacterium]
MSTNHGADGVNSRQKGFTYLELVVVIAIISILAVFALDRYRRLLVDVERTTVEQDLGIMRSAIGMQVASQFLSGNMDGLNGLVSSNPMDMLAEQPKNYLGPISNQEPNEIEPGHWYFDTDIRALVYLVRNSDYFETELRGVARIRFKIYPVYADKTRDGKRTTFMAGLALRPIDPYRWLKKD